jgi:hypothetical protein
MGRASSKLACVQLVCGSGDKLIGRVPSVACEACERRPHANEDADGGFERIHVIVGGRIDASIVAAPAVEIAACGDFEDDRLDVLQSVTPVAQDDLLLADCLRNQPDQALIQELVVEQRRRAACLGKEAGC